MKRKSMLTILFIFIVLGIIFIYDKSGDMKNISDDIEQSNIEQSDYADVREFINKVMTLKKGSYEDKVRKVLGNPDNSTEVNIVSRYVPKSDFYYFDNALFVIFYHNNKLESASWISKENCENDCGDFISIELE